MVNNRQELKEGVHREIDLLRHEMVDIARTIHANPEVGYREHESARALSLFLKRHGFRIDPGVGGMDTAFLASYPDTDEGPIIALLAEYDALPGMGHGCGHNLIGTASAGAAIAVSKVFPGPKGKVVVIGCPCEEAGVDDAGGKVRLIEGEYFKDVDAAMIFHPAPRTTIGGETTALIGLEFIFTGKAAHAAGNPWDGINALDGVLQTFNAINALRQHVKDDVRIHGIVTQGGDAPNIVPEYAAARFFIRSENREYLKEVIIKVENCAKGGALATGSKLEIKRFNNFYDTMNSNPVLSGIIEDNLQEVGLKIEGRKKGKGSTDFGNVTWVVPACELAIRLGNGIIPHTREFLEASGSDEGYEVMCLAAKVLAMSTIDLLFDPELLKKAKTEFGRDRG